MTKILPAVTKPWRVNILRRHTPRARKGAKGFRSYRPCLRWEFGFSCAFCLCHETDLAPYGVEGSAITHVEHFVPKSHDKTGINLYDNCFYICRFCNIAHGAAWKENDDGPFLFNPCDRAWLEAFLVSKDKIQPRTNTDEHARYTSEVYELNDARKVRMRRMRRITIQQCVRFLKRTRTLESDLLDRLESGGGMNEVDTAWAIFEARRRAYMDLLRFRAVPIDRDSSCLCGHPGHHRLPAVLEEQTSDLSDLRRARKGAF